MTGNPDLNAVLSSIQENIILPAHLPEKQRKIVFDPKKRSHLEQNPIIIELDGLEHKFSTIDRFKGVENSKKALNKALDKMYTAEEWDNLATLLAGYKKAGIKLRPSHWGKIIRVAGTRGHIYTIIECAKQSDKTGLALKTPEVVVRVLAYVNDKITTSEATPAGTQQALKWSELVLDLLQRPEHTAAAQQTRERLHFSKLVRGLALLPRSAAAQIPQASPKELDLLRDEVTLLASLWEDSVGKSLAEIPEFAILNPQTTPATGDETAEALNGCAYVQVLAQNIKGMEIAQKVLGDDAKVLSPTLDALKKHLDDFAMNSETRSKSWDEEYTKVIGEAPSWPAPPVSATAE